MSESVAAKLRELARDHYEGRIAFDAYVRTRSDVLDSLIGLSAVTADDPAVITQPRRNTGEFAVTAGEHAAQKPPALPVDAPSPAPGSPSATAHSNADIAAAAAAAIESASPVTAAESPGVAVAADPTRRPDVPAKVEGAPASTAPARRATDGAGAAAPAAPQPREEKRRPSDAKPAPKVRLATTGPQQVTKAASQPAAVSTPPQQKSSRANWVVSGGVAALVLGIAISWLWSSGAYLKLLGRDKASDATAASAVANRARLLVDEFLLANDWSDATVAQFNFKWKTLAFEERRTAFESNWLQEFIDAVRSRVKEQRALAAGAEEQRMAGPLAELAATFGIDVSAPDRVSLPAEYMPGYTPPAVAQAPSGPAATNKPAANKPAANKPEAKPAPIAAAPAATSAPVATAQPKRETPPPKPAAAPQAAAAPAAVAGATGEKQSRPECITVPVRSRKPLCQDKLSIGGFGPEIALISVAPFPMGSTAAAEERPVRTVTLAKPYGLSVYEVSQSEFKAYCMAANRPFPAQPTQGNDLPVVNVTWNEARGYADWLGSVTGQKYRLPSEAEWEHAARAGETAIYPQSIQPAPTDAHFSAIERATAVAARSGFKANPFGLVHMLGNAREWVLDGWSPNHEGAPADGTPRSPDAAGNRVVRGGSYTDTAPKLRLSLRDKLGADTRDPTTGFRIARDIP